MSEITAGITRILHHLLDPLRVTRLALYVTLTALIYGAWMGWPWWNAGGVTTFARAYVPEVTNQELATPFLVLGLVKLFALCTDRRGLAALMAAFLGAGWLFLAALLAQSNPAIVAIPLYLMLAAANWAAFLGYSFSRRPYPPRLVRRRE